MLPPTDEEAKVLEARNRADRQKQVLVESVFVRELDRQCKFAKLAGFRHAALGFGFFEAPIDGKCRCCNSGSRKTRCSADLPS